VEDADSILNEETGNFSNVYLEDGGKEYLQVFTRGALRKLGDDVVFTSGSLEWALGTLKNTERAVINQGHTSEIRITGADILPWIEENQERIIPMNDHARSLITALTDISLVLLRMLLLAEPICQCSMRSRGTCSATCTPTISRGKQPERMVGYS